MQGTDGGLDRCVCVGGGWTGGRDGRYGVLEQAGLAAGWGGGVGRRRHAGRLPRSFWNPLLDWEPLEEEQWGGKGTEFHVAVLSSKCLGDIPEELLSRHWMAVSEAHF